MRENKLLLNEEKTELLLVGTKQYLCRVEFLTFNFNEQLKILLIDNCAKKIYKLLLLMNKDNTGDFKISTNSTYVLRYRKDCTLPEIWTKRSRN